MTQRCSLLGHVVSVLQTLINPKKTWQNGAFDHGKLKIRLWIYNSPKPKMTLKRRTKTMNHLITSWSFHLSVLLHSFSPFPTNFKGNHATFISLFSNFWKWLSHQLFMNTEYLWCQYLEMQDDWLKVKEKTNKNCEELFEYTKNQFILHETWRKAFHINGTKRQKKKIILQL